MDALKKKMYGAWVLSTVTALYPNLSTSITYVILDDKHTIDFNLHFYICFLFGAMYWYLYYLVDKNLANIEFKNYHFNKYIQIEILEQIWALWFFISIGYYPFILYDASVSGLPFYVYNYYYMQRILKNLLVITCQGICLESIGINSLLRRMYLCGVDYYDAE